MSEELPSLCCGRRGASTMAVFDELAFACSVDGLQALLEDAACEELPSRYHASLSL